MQDLESLQCSVVESEKLSDIQFYRKSRRRKSKTLSILSYQSQKRDVENRGSFCSDHLCTIVSVVILITILTVIALVLYLGKQEP